VSIIILLYSQTWKTYQSYTVQQKLNRVLDSDDEAEGVNPRSKGQRKVSIIILLYSQTWKTYRSYTVQRKLNRVLDSDDEAEGVNPRSNGQRKVSIPITSQIIKYLPLFN
jgi:sortase (surface protein transpeptidase)